MRRLFSIIISLVLLTTITFFMPSPACSEHESWDCPGCDRIGNTGNYCGGCAHPSPWLSSDNNSSPASQIFTRVNSIEWVRVNNDRLAYGFQEFGNIQADEIETSCTDSKVASYGISIKFDLHGVTGRKEVPLYVALRLPDGNIVQSWTKGFLYEDNGKCWLTLFEEDWDTIFASYGCIPTGKYSFLFGVDENDITEFPFEITSPNSTIASNYSTVKFGHYEQDNNLSNGKESIEWIVLDEDLSNNRVLLLSLYVLDTEIYYNKYMHVSWANSRLRNWLNSTFLEAAFTQSEQKAILKTKLNNDLSEQRHDPMSGPKEFASTTDYVFLLNYMELNQYVGNQLDRAVKATPYALSRRAWTVSRGEYIGYSVWLLRAYGSFSDAVDLDGDWTTARVDMPGVGIRPAMWVDASLVIF